MTIPGMFDYSKLFEDVISKIDSGTIVEIGVWQGASTSCLCNLIKGKDINLICVDNFKGENVSEQHYNKLTKDNQLDSFLYNLRDLGYEFRPYDPLNNSSKYTYIKSNSVGAASYITEQCNFVFIDGDHNYKNVCEDIQLYLPKITKGGFIAGHDYNNDGVKRAVKDTLSGYEIKSIRGDKGDSWLVEL